MHPLLLISLLYLTALTTFKSTTAQILPTEEAWWNAVCRGEKLDQAMRWSDPYATSYIAPLHSPWDGDLEQDLSRWGYSESSRAEMCDFDTFWGLELAFRSLGVDAKSTLRDGPNKCFHVGHGDVGKKRADGRFWPVKEQNYTVGDRTYRVTNAFSTIGINPSAGMIFFISRISAGEAAKKFWGIDPPPRNELPSLRANSDFAWGFWNRVNHPDRVKAFWSIGVSNLETNDILRQAFKTYKPPPWYRKVDGVQSWPGTDFDIVSVEAQAILGSPNGIAAGFFLAQHKRQLGGNKMIYKITVFKAVQPVTGHEFPTLIFWVKDVPDIYGREDGSLTGLEKEETDVGIRTGNRSSFVGKYEEPRVLKISEDGKDMVREHTIRAGS